MVLALVTLPSSALTASRGQASPVSTPQSPGCPSLTFETWPPPHSYRPPCSKESSAALLSPSHAFPHLHLALTGGPPARHALPFPLLPTSTLLFQLELKPLPEPFQPPCPLCSLPPQNSGNTYCWLHCSSLSHVQLGNLAGVVGLRGPKLLCRPSDFHGPGGEVG